MYDLYVWLYTQYARVYLHLHDTYRVGTQKKVSLRLQEVPLPKGFQILTRTSVEYLQVREVCM